MKLPKIPIDYSKAGTGEAPFDGAGCLLHMNSIVIGYGVYDDGSGQCFKEFYSFKKMVNDGVDSPTHYTPMPEFEEVNNDHK